MTPSELRTLINNDPQAKAYFDAGNDSACAVRCSEIAPPVLVELRLSRMGVRSLYADPLDGQTVLATLDAVAKQNPIIADIASFMGPGVHPSTLPDFGLPVIRDALTAPTGAGGLGLSAELAAPILRAAERQPAITHMDIARARQEG